MTKGKRALVNMSFASMVTIQRQLSMQRLCNFCVN